ncbi:hypothetical protein EG329_009132 [Mollisiaceae sp. DMI_Dod_QoI]|nr:hypothetical protein EG329_009132 [Helotiales sp. DMI_Dod_QoI]
MPVVKKLEPNDADILTERIFSCNPDEESDVVIGAVREHIDEWGTMALFKSNPKGKQEVILQGKCIVYLIQGAFELGAELIDVDKHVVDKEGFGYAIEGEELIRLRKQTAVVIIYVDWNDDKELLALGPEMSNR